MVRSVLAKRRGRGPFSAQMLRCLEQSRCEQCGAHVPYASVPNALVIDSVGVHYLCRTCRGLGIEHLGRFENFPGSQYFPYLAVDLFVNLRWNGVQFTNFEVVKLLRLRHRIFLGNGRSSHGLDRVFTAYEAEASLMGEPDRSACGECLDGRIVNGACAECG